MSMNLLRSLVRTLMSTIAKLNQDLIGKEVKKTLYMSMIGSLIYLIFSYPNIYFSNGVCVRFQVFPKESSILASKRIIMSMVQCILAIWISCDITTEVVSYSNVGWAKCNNDEESTAGALLLG